MRNNRVGGTFPIKLKLKSTHLKTFFHELYFTENKIL